MFLVILDWYPHIWKNSHLSWSLGFGVIYRRHFTNQHSYWFWGPLKLFLWIILFVLNVCRFSVRGTSWFIFLGACNLLFSLVSVWFTMGPLEQQHTITLIFILSGPRYLESARSHQHSQTGDTETSPWSVYWKATTLDTCSIFFSFPQGERPLSYTDLSLLYCWSFGGATCHPALLCSQQLTGIESMLGPISTLRRQASQKPLPQGSPFRIVRMLEMPSSPFFPSPGRSWELRVASQWHDTVLVGQGNLWEILSHVFLLALTCLALHLPGLQKPLNGVLDFSQRGWSMQCC